MHAKTCFYIRPGGGGTTMEKRLELLLEKLELNPKRRPIWVWFKLSISLTITLKNTLKAKNSGVWCWTPPPQVRPNFVIYTPKRSDEQSISFSYGSPYPTGTC